MTESIVSEPIISTKHFMTEEDEDRLLNEGESVLDDSDSEAEVLEKENLKENSSNNKVFLFFLII